MENANNCPKCRREPLVNETYEGVEIERCPVCKGMLFDHGELEALLGKNLGGTADTFAFSPTSDVMDQVAAHCDRCGQGMTPCMGPAEVRLDWCSTCGSVFLDQGELATLQLHGS
jgi:Zn-finger nucleic acid-binding protein